MSPLLRLLVVLALGNTSVALHAAATIQSAYHTIDTIVAQSGTVQPLYNGYGERPSIPSYGVTCSFTVAQAQPRKDVIIDFCVKESGSLRTKFRITLGEQRDTQSDKPFSVHSEIEHIMPNTGNIIERSETTHSAGTPFVQNGKRFHLRFGIREDSISMRVFENGSQEAFLEKEFFGVPRQKYYMVFASGNSTVTYENIVMWALPKSKKKA